MIFDKFDPTALQADAVRSTQAGTFSENYYASQKSANYHDGGQASSAILRDLWGPMVDQVNELTGSNFYSPADHLNVGIGISATAGNPEQMYRWRAKEFMDFVTEANTKSPGLIPKPILDLMSFEALNEKTITEAKLAAADFAAVDQNSEGFMIGVAQFLGALSAGAVDPSNVPYLAFGGAGAKSLTGFALREALINGGSEAALQPAIAEWYGKVGLEYTSQDFINNVVGAALVGGALPIAGAGAKAIAGAGAGAVSRGIDINSGVTKPTRALIDFLDSSQPQLDRMLTPDQMISGVETLKSAGVKISREANTAITLAQDLQDIETSNPISGNPVGTIIDHASTMADAQRSLFNGEVPKIKAVPIEMVKPDAILQQADNLDGFVFRFNPNEIGVDAKTFQFKMGGDAFGVSERLRGVKVWDPILGGEILVYEYADGRMFVADGHQRLGLAKRIMSEDPSQNVVIYGRKLREADGVTPEQAMVVAAIKNIAEGSGSAIDAAKVARIDPAGFSSLIGKTLPPSSVLVRQANDMINLTDNAFGAIINEVIPANYGAIIGRVLSDRKDLQDAAVKILAKSEPANVFQAEAIVRQVREADAEQVQQFSLFGEETVTESLFTERAKILDQAYRQLKQDKATFANLTRNADRIEAEGGNVLDRQLNEQKATQDAQTIALLQTLANRKGPVSDALSAAARAFRDTGSYGRPTRDFLESVRNAITAGDLDRISSSDIGRTLDGPSPGSADTVGKEPVLDGFEEPNGVAAEQQIGQLTQDMFPEPEPTARAEAPADQAAPTARPIIETEQSARAAVEGTAIVDPKTGQPVVLYHGTDKQFDLFDLGAGEKFDGGFAGSRAIYLSAAEYYATAYGVARSRQTGRPSRTIKAYADIKNPFVIRRIAKVEEIPFDIEKSLQQHYLKPFFDRTGIIADYRISGADRDLLRAEYERISPLVSDKMREITGGMDAMEMANALYAGASSIDDFGNATAINAIPELQTMRENLPRVLQELGYDGVIGQTSNVGELTQFGEVVVFDPKQIHIFDQGEPTPPPQGSIGELKGLINAGADLKQIDQHPVVLQAVKDMESRPDTSKTDGYGTDDWIKTRTYVIDNKQVVGVRDALREWEIQADTLAWVNKKIKPEPVARNRQATIILGPPAAGKSTIAEEFAIFNKAAIIDSDEIKKSIPEFDGGIGAAAVHEESSDLNKALTVAMLKSGKNVVIPKVGDKASSILKQIQLLKDNGYTVFLMDMAVTSQNAKLRMYGRFVSTGRLIPPSYVDAVGNLPSGVYRDLKGQGAADGFAQIDNNGGIGSARPIIDKSGKDFLAGSALNMDKSGRPVGGPFDGTVRESGQPVSREISPGSEALVTSQVTEMQRSIMDELQPDDMISVGLVQDANGDIVPQTMTMAQIKTMLDAEDKFIEQLGICGI